MLQNNGSFCKGLPLTKLQACSPVASSCAPFSNFYDLCLWREHFKNAGPTCCNLPGTSLFKVCYAVKPIIFRKDNLGGKDEKWPCTWVTSIAMFTASISFTYSSGISTAVGAAAFGEEATVRGPWAETARGEARKRGTRGGISMGGCGGNGDGGSRREECAGERRRHHHGRVASPVDMSA